MPRIDYIIENENLKITDDGKEALFKLSKGDMRRIINVLQVFFCFLVLLIFRVLLYHLI
jgi:replication-associated recombination protein RarA